MQIADLIGVMVGQNFFIIIAETFPLLETKSKCIEKMITLTPLGTVLSERLTGPQLIRKFPALVQYCIHEHPPPVPILNQINPIHASTSHLLKIWFNVIVLFVPLSSKWSLPLRFPHQNTILKTCQKYNGANSHKTEG